MSNCELSLESGNNLDLGYFCQLLAIFSMLKIRGQYWWPVTWWYQCHFQHLISKLKSFHMVHFWSFYPPPLLLTPTTFPFPQTFRNVRWDNPMSLSVGDFFLNGGCNAESWTFQWSICFFLGGGGQLNSSISGHQNNSNLSSLSDM